MNLNILYFLGLSLLYIKVIYAIRCTNVKCLNSNNIDEIFEVNLRNNRLKEIPNKIFKLKKFKSFKFK